MIWYFVVGILAFLLGVCIGMLFFCKEVRIPVEVEKVIYVKDDESKEENKKSKKSKTKDLPKTN